MESNPRVAPNWFGAVAMNHSLAAYCVMNYYSVSAVVHHNVQVEMVKNEVEAFNKALRDLEKRYREEGKTFFELEMKGTLLWKKNKKGRKADTKTKEEATLPARAKPKGRKIETPKTEETPEMTGEENKVTVTRTSTRRKPRVDYAKLHYWGMEIPDISGDDSLGDEESDNQEDDDWVRTHIKNPTKRNPSSKGTIGSERGDQDTQ